MAGNLTAFLDEYQRAAVESDAKNVLVLAGAGSGKTRVLIERIRYLLTQGINPHSIVAITYTNMAADEMKARIADLEGSGDILIGTIHSLANKILQASGKVYDILDSEKSNQIWKDLIARYCTHLTFEKYLEYMDMSQMVELGKISESALEDFLKPSEAYEFSELNSLRAYDTEAFPVTVRQEAANRNLITFDELLELATEYFVSIGASLEHLLVDELQDIGVLEYKFIKSLNALSYYLVGDDKQSIYGFKGADVGIFKAIVEHKNFQKYYLINNYRNPSNIIALGEKVLQHNDQINMPSLVAKGNQAAHILITGQAKLETLLQQLAEEISEGVSAYKDWFILARTNRQLNEIADKLVTNNIPFVGIQKSDIDLEQLKDYLAGDYVKIMTVHASKGLEANNVLLYGNFPTVVPRWRLNEEERRVMYVGVTRAKKKLWIAN